VGVDDDAWAVGVEEPCGVAFLHDRSAHKPQLERGGDGKSASIEIQSVIHRESTKESTRVEEFVRMNLKIVRALWEVVLNGFNKTLFEIQPDSFRHDECGEDEDRLLRIR
jgi:hypothetical protein